MNIYHWKSIIVWWILLTLLGLSETFWLFVQSQSPETVCSALVTGVHAVCTTSSLWQLWHVIKARFSVTLLYIIYRKGCVRLGLKLVHNIHVFLGKTVESASCFLTPFRNFFSWNFTCLYNKTVSIHAVSLKSLLGKELG